MVRELLEVGLLLVKLLPELEKLFPLALANGHVLAGLLAAMEGRAVGAEARQFRRTGKWKT